jgi:hypothetical protein
MSAPERIHEVELQKDKDGNLIGFRLINGCNNRHVAGKDPKDITLTLRNYFPLDDFSQTRIKPSNPMYGKEILIKPGTVLSSYDGERLVYEAGCKTVIFLQLSPKNPKTHFKFFIQDQHQFLIDLTIRNVAARVTKATAPMVTLVKYEMYFLMGLVSTMSLPLLVATLSADATYEGLKIKLKYDAFKKLVKTLTEESEKIKGMAPTLHSKMMEFLEIEKTQNFNAKNTIKNLPKTIVTDEKVQAQVAGIFAGKFSVAAKAVNAKALFITLLIQIGTKSVTKAFDSYLSPVNSRYKPLLEEIQGIDWADPKGAQQAATKVAHIMKESGVKLSADEILKIAKEVQSNNSNLNQSIVIINNAFNDFLKTKK